MIETPFCGEGYCVRRVRSTTRRACTVYDNNSWSHRLWPGLLGYHVTGTATPGLHA